jgi:broad specificity polyphosphatase/5'/3'-nucleotidase SurE
MIGLYLLFFTVNRKLLSFQETVKRVDLQGRPYYWQWGTTKPEKEFEVGTDVHAVHGEHAISTTPLSLNMSTTAGREEISKLGKKLHKAGFTVH